MAIYRTIQMSFWTDPKVIDDFTPEDKFFYLYLMTNPHTNLIGCYEISIKQISDETGYSKETIEKLLERFSEIHKVIGYSKTTKEIFLFNWHKHNWTNSAKLDKPLLSQIAEVKNAGFKKSLIEMFNNRNNNSDSEEDTVSIQYEYPIDTTNTVTDTVTDTVSYSSSKSNVLNLNSLIDIEEFLPIKENEELYLLIKDWMEYKDAKGKQHLHYAEKSIKSLLKTFIDNNNKYGTSELRSVVDFTIGQGYQGIVWDKLQAKREVNAGTNANKSDWLKMWENA